MNTFADLPCTPPKTIQSSCVLQVSFDFVAPAISDVVSSRLESYWLWWSRRCASCHRDTQFSNETAEVGQRIKRRSMGKAGNDKLTTSRFEPSRVFLTCKTWVRVPPSLEIKCALGGFIDRSINFGTAVRKEKLLKLHFEMFVNVQTISNFDGLDKSVLMSNMVSFRPPFSYT